MERAAEIVSGGVGQFVQRSGGRTRIEFEGAELDLSQWKFEAKCGCIEFSTWLFLEGADILPGGVIQTHLGPALAVVLQLAQRSKRLS